MNKGIPTINVPDNWVGKPGILNKRSMQVQASLEAAARYLGELSETERESWIVYLLELLEQEGSYENAYIDMLLNIKNDIESIIWQRVIDRASKEQQE